jgi:hypothetical protein
VASVRQQIDEVLNGINASDEVARTAALEALRYHQVAPEPTVEELLAGTPLREVSSTPVEKSDGDEAPAKSPRRAPKSVPTNEESLLDDDPSGTDVVNEIFARLRKATLEERGVTLPQPKKATVAKPETPVGVLFRRRDEALQDSLAVLTRRVKRALQDDQNIMLDRLRTVQAMITTELEDEHTQRARYADASFEALSHAAQAGVQFAKEEGVVAEVDVSVGALEECTTDLAVTVVLALRKKILSDSSGDGPERANAAYREWRGARVERLCTDAARRAFHLGVVTASKGRSIRFFAVPNDAPCDLCAHDSESGERIAGENFPSGSPYPPLHAGCACTVVPV